MLIKILIIFFTLLIGYQLFLAVFSFMKKDNLVEGLENESTTEYKPYNTNDPNNPNSALILAQQNAGNIEVIKGRIDGLDGVKGRVDTMQQNIDSMQTQIDALVQQQADYANDLAGSEPVTITGTEEDEEDEEVV
jgi:hypothetical protein